MSIHIPEPCHEDWDAMTARGRGRYCASCDKTVLDFTKMTRRQAERALREGGDEVCGNVAFDAWSGAPVYRPEPSRARHWAGGLVLVAALTQACGEAESPIGADPVAIVDEPDAPCELGPPMQPVTSTPGDAPPSTGSVDAAVEDAGDGTPTAEQAALTEEKERPIRHIRRGRIARRPRIAPPHPVPTPVF